MSANVVTAQQYLGGINQSNVIIDDSVIESLGPLPNFSPKPFGNPSKGEGRNNFYAGPKLKFPKTSRSQPYSEIGVIVLRPPRSIKKPSPNHEKKSSKEVKKTTHALAPQTVDQTRMIRPPPPPQLLAPSKMIKVLPTPEFSQLLERPIPLPPAIPALEQSMKLPPISSKKAPTQNVSPLRSKFSKPTVSSEIRIASIPSIVQPKKAEQISRIEFKTGSFELNSDASAALKDLSKTLEKNSALRLQLHAYASAIGGSAIKAKRLALSRALAARAYLIDRGVDITRIAVKAFGDQSTNGPADRIDIILEVR